MAIEGRVAPARDDADYTVELIESPRELAQARAHAINLQVAELACRACGGTDEAAVRQGWEEYCLGPGGRCQDHDRVVLAWDGERLIGFGGYVVCRPEPDTTVLWWKAGGVDPAYQGRRAFAEIVETMSDLRWLTSFGPPTYFVMRTPNPLVYDLTRRWWARHPDWYEGYAPKIAADGTIEAPPDGAREAAIRITAALWPETEFDPATFVLRNFLGDYGHDIWRIPSPVSPADGTQRFFDGNLRAGNRDALLALCFFNR